MKPFEVAHLRLERASQGVRRQAIEMRSLHSLRTTAQKKKISSQSTSRFFFLLALFFCVKIQLAIVAGPLYVQLNYSLFAS